MRGADAAAAAECSTAAVRDPSSQPRAEPSSSPTVSPQPSAGSSSSYDALPRGARPLTPPPSIGGSGWAARSSSSGDPGAAPADTAWPAGGARRAAWPCQGMPLQLRLHLAAGVCQIVAQAAIVATTWAGTAGAKGRALLLLQLLVKLAVVGGACAHPHMYWRNR